MNDTVTTTGQDRDRLAQAEALRKRGDLDDAIRLDIDFFKRINDTWSHATGDGVLQQVGVILRAHCRDNDLVARIGGEEFALVLDHCKHERLIETCNRIRKIVEKYPWENVAKGLRVTMSFGVTGYHEGDTLKSLMIRADDALYRAKRNGRNRVERS